VLIRVKTNEEEATEYELYCYKKGMMYEYVNHVMNLTGDEIQLLDRWLLEGGSVHSNPWGLYDENRKPVDFIPAYRLQAK